MSLGRHVFAFCSLFSLLFSSLTYAQVQNISSVQEIVIFKSSTDNRIKAIKAAKIDKMNKYFIIEEATDGQPKTTVEESLLIKRHKVSPTIGTEGPSDEEIENIVQDYTASIKEYSEVASSLEPYVLEWREFQKDRQRRIAEGLQLRMNKFLAVQYDAATNYEKIVVEERVKEGKELISLIPDQAQSITVYLKPWETELSFMNEGKVKYKGEWVTREELEALKKKEGAEIIAKPPPMPLMTIGAVSMSGSTLIAISVVAGISMILLVSCIFMGVWRQLSGLDIVGFLCLLMGMAGLAMYGYYYTFYSVVPDEYQKISAKLPDGYTKSAFEDMMEHLYSGNRVLADRFRGRKKAGVGEAEINDFIKRAVKIEEKDSSDKYALRRTGYQVRLLPKQIYIFEPSKIMGRDVLISYKIDYTVESDGFHFNDCTVYVGKAWLPNKFGAYLWRPNQEVIAKIIRMLGMPGVFKMVEMSDNQLFFSR